MVGNATLRIVLSSPITSRERHRTASVHHRALFDSRPFRFIIGTVLQLIQKRKRLVSKSLNEQLGKRLPTFESRLSPRLRKGSIMSLVSQRRGRHPPDPPDHGVRGLTLSCRGNS